jgi:hypothetical protein
LTAIGCPGCRRFGAWRKIDGQWLIQAELYVPTHCSGSKYCDRRP